MFFSANGESTVLWGDGFHGTNILSLDTEAENEANSKLKSSLKYLQYDTFILCNPNAMAY